MSNSVRPDRIIFEHLEPESLVPGGIDTCIHDLVKYGDEFRFGLVGITRDPAVSIGEWTQIQFAGKEIDFLPVARFDRAKNYGSRRLRMPHSLRLVVGILRHHRKVPRVMWQSHRIETGYFLSLLRPLRFIQFIHNDSEGLTGEHSDSSWKGFKQLYRLLEKRVLSRAAGVVVFNRTDGVRLVESRPDVFVAQTWFDPDVYNPSDRKERSCAAGIKVCWVGRLEAQKDPILAVETMAELLKIAPGSNLVILGDGSLGAEVSSRAVELGVAEKINFLGSCDRATVAQVMVNSDCLLMTSHYEGSPRVLVEAGGTGLPVAATSGADPDGALRTGINGVSIQSRDPVELAEGLVQASKYSSLDCCNAAAHRAARPSVERILSVGIPTE